MTARVDTALQGVSSIVAKNLRTKMSQKMTQAATSDSAPVDLNVTWNIYDRSRSSGIAPPGDKVNPFNEVDLSFALVAYPKKVRHLQSLAS